MFASTTVQCPAGKHMASCQCWSEGNPGCESAHIEADNGVLTCRATSALNNLNDPSHALKPCAHSGAGASGWRGSDPYGHNERPYITCAPDGWTPSALPIFAKARCAKLDLPPGGAEQLTSTPSRIAPRDASDATCPQGTLTGCATQPVGQGKGPGLGARVEDGDEDGRAECVGYSNGMVAVTAQASCASAPTCTSSGSCELLSVPNMVETPVEQMIDGTFTTAHCPAPFVLSSCSCFSENGLCRGAAAEQGGCNVSHVLPKYVFQAGVEAHSVCVWYGPSSSLLGRSASSTCAQPVHGLELPDKAWLPEEWRHGLDISDSSTSTPGHWKQRGPITQDDAASLVMLGMGSSVIVLIICCGVCSLIVLTLRTRHQRQMGGAPTMSPTRTVGDVVQVTSPTYLTNAVSPTLVAHGQPVPYGSNYASQRNNAVAPYVAPAVIPTSSTTTPLVLADSAALHHIEEDSTPSRV
mmetsp:Transcript_34248/g.68192  ORF Transcript_34248/g.68192 Transcript_34248/m.68192 type:complete len:468 (-) Transcript_34248:278-1681(-)